MQGARIDAARMGVLIQRMAGPGLSFILHTANPTTGDRHEVCAELAPGFGETLASGREPGSPYRVLVRTDTGAVRLAACASFSRAVFASPSGALTRHVVDYSTVEMSAEDGALSRLATRLGEIGRFLEYHLGGPQDVEGVEGDGTITVVQSRPQPGL